MKAKITMKKELPKYPNTIFTFRRMFSIIMMEFNQRVCLLVAICQHMSPSQMAMIGTAMDAMNKATKLVAYGDNEALGMEMLAAQVDCQQAIEDGCRYEFDTATAMKVAHHELYLCFLKTAVEIVDIVAEWMNKKDDSVSKVRLIENTKLMSLCFALYKFSHVPSDYITKGSLIQIVPLIRFQTTGVESLDQSIEDEKKYAQSQNTANDVVLKNAMEMYVFHKMMWINPVRSNLDRAYMHEIAKYN